MLVIFLMSICGHTYANNTVRVDATKRIRDNVKLMTFKFENIWQ